MVTIYSTTWCGFCKMAKEYFKAKNVEFEEFNIETDADRQKEMIDKSGQMGVPVIDINGTIIVGFDRPQIDAALRSSE